MSRTNNACEYILDENTDDAICEAYKTARTNLVFSLARNDNKIVTVTSCSSGEGKSINCINMAIALSQIGEKVLIIDANLRNPSMHTLFGIKCKYGLSLILGGFCANVDDAVNKNVRKNLDVIVAGPIPPNSSELLSSPYMKQTLDRLKDRYDYIIIDTPAINGTPDSQILNTLVSGMILVVRAEHTSHVALQEALKTIKLANGKILGFLKVDCNPKMIRNMRKNNKKRQQGEKSYYDFESLEKIFVEETDEYGDKPVLESDAKTDK